MQDMKICDANQTDKQVYKKWRKKNRDKWLTERIMWTMLDHVCFW